MDEWPSCSWLAGAFALSSARCGFRTVSSPACCRTLRTSTSAARESSTDISFRCCLPRPFPVRESCASSAARWPPVSFRSTEEDTGMRRGSVRGCPRPPSFRKSWRTGRTVLSSAAARRWSSKSSVDISTAEIPTFSAAASWRRRNAASAYVIRHADVPEVTQLTTSSFWRRRSELYEIIQSNVFVIRTLEARENPRQGRSFSIYIQVQNYVYIVLRCIESC